MQLINSTNNQYRDANPSTLDAGTPIPAACMNTIQDELSNIVTGYGLTLDSNNNGQVKSALESHFAPISSPDLTGIPLTTQPGSSAPANQIATVDYVNQKMLTATVGFTPVQQSGGADQGTNKIYIGWGTDATGLKAQVDATDLGYFVFQSRTSPYDGISEIGYNSSTKQFSFLELDTNSWHSIYSTTDIDGKNFIPSDIAGNNQTITNLTWNTSSASPVISYGSNNSIEYLATTTWVNGNFVTDSTWSSNINQAVLTTSSPSFNSTTVKSIAFDNGGSSSIYQDSNKGDIVIQTYNGSDNYSVFNEDGTISLGGNTTIGGSLSVNTIDASGAVSCGPITSSGDIKTGSNNWVYTNTIGSYGGTVDINAQLQQYGVQVATETWVTSNFINDTEFSNDFNSGDDRVVSWAYGKKAQFFQVHAGTNTWVTFPQAFGSGTPVVLVGAAGELTNQVDTDFFVWGMTTSGFYVNPRNQAGQIQLIAFGLS